MLLTLYLRALERPIVHRYKEIELFPEVLSNSQKRNWSTRLFLSEARTNLTREAVAGVPSKWTTEELDALELALTEHEAWLDDGVEKQKRAQMSDDPAIETKDMRSKAKSLELHLQKLVKRKAAKVKKTPKEADKAGEADQDPGDRPSHDEL